MNKTPADTAPKNEPHDIMISIDRLKIGFGQQNILKNISLQLHRGENLVVMGKSGAGKSVLIKCIVRLLAPEEGSIHVLGYDVLSLNRIQLNEMRKQIGFLFQGAALYDSMTVRENLMFPLSRIKKHLSEKEMDSKINAALQHVGLLESIDQMPSELSGGMRKRISLARTIVVEPSVMLYDEPTTGLDPVTSSEISSLINDVKEKYKTSSIIITHDISCAIATADRLIMIHEGEIYSEGSVSSFRSSGDPFIKAFFSQTN